MEKTYDDDEIEIDLLELLGEFRRKIWIILGTIILFGSAAGAFSAFVLTPQYKSTAMVYILSKETTLTSLADLQIGSQLTKDYKIIVTSRRVLNQVIEDMELNLTYKELVEKVTIDNPQDTRILSISVEDPVNISGRRSTLILFLIGRRRLVGTLPEWVHVGKRLPLMRLMRNGIWRKIVGPAQMRSVRSVPLPNRIF